MSDTPQIGASFSAGGMDAALDPALLGAERASRAVNLRLEGQFWRTRSGVREIPFLVRDDVEAAAFEEWQRLNHQGAMFYNPSRGQSALSFGSDSSSIMQCAAGRKFRIQLVGSGSQTFARLEEVTGTAASDDKLGLAWWAQAEKYAICADGENATWIFDSAAGRLSEGFEGAPDGEAEIPNPVSAMVYAHGRLHVVRHGREIVVGDQIHLQNLTTSQDVIRFTQMQQLDTAQVFAPPSAMGNILSLDVMAMKDTQHGHEGVFAQCEDGMFSVNTNVAPRSDWDKLALTRHALLRTAAAGPYAVDQVDGDLFFRSRYGIQSFRSASAESGALGNPYAPISEEVKTFMAGDREADLRYASVASWYPQRRLLCTVYPVLRHRHRWHRGFIVANFNPRGSTVTGERAWEGLWTLPPRLGGVVQFVEGVFVGRERLFAITWNPVDRKMRLCEVDPELEEDRLADGTRVRISSQLQTRAVDAETIFRNKKYSDGRLYLKDCRGKIDVGVWFRDAAGGEWKKWRHSRLDVSTFDGNTMAGRGGRNLIVALGAFPAADREVRRLQFLIRVVGRASIEAIKPRAGKLESEDDLEINCKEAVLAGTAIPSGYNDYEYTESPRWEDQ